jgi:FkbM family methyltransferase
MYFDIGANIGNWTKENINNADKFIVVEASPVTHSKLINNISSLNNSSNIVCLNVAVCDNNNQPITFYNSGTDTLSTINKEWLTGEKSRFCNIDRYDEITVNTITIDKMISSFGEPDLIKIDVEGGEYECIKSLTKKVSNLCFEWASEMNDVSFKSLDYLYSLGFRQFHLQFEDNYTYRPNEYNETLISIKEKLSNTTPKKEWGMIWCK